MKVLIDNGHGYDTPGKRSPHGLLIEARYTRRIASVVVDALKRKGVDAQLLTPENHDLSLKTRVTRTNNLCRKLGSQNVLLVSVHLNADGPGDKWTPASGFSVFVSKNSSTRSKAMAQILTDRAISKKLTGNRAIPAERYWTWSWTPSDIYLLAKTNCPAVLTENLFMTNKADVQWLMSEQGAEILTDLHTQAILDYLKKFGNA